MPKKQPKRGRLWLNDGSCIRLRPEHKDHVWSYDFMMARTIEGRVFRILTIIDEYTRECLAILTQRRITSQDVIEQLFYLFIFRGVPEHIRSDNGPEFIAKAVRRWLNDLGVNTLFIEPGSPWENGYIESFNGKLRDELLNREIFTTLIEAKILIEEWRKEYNQVRPHSALNYRPPAPETIAVDSNSTSGTINGGRSPLATDIIKEVVEEGRGDFLSHQSTLDNFRDAFWVPELFEHYTLRQWQEKGAKPILDRVKEIAKRRISEHHFELERNVQKELDRIYKKTSESLIR